MGASYGLPLGSEKGSSRLLVKVVQIFNAVLHLQHIPSAWKQVEIIVIPKVGKPPHLPFSYKPISLLSCIGKLFERLYNKRLEPLIEEREIIPNHQFGFRSNHATIEQVHRVTDLIERTLEKGEVCSAVFLDVGQTFDRVHHESLLLKLYKSVPLNHYRLLRSYLEDRSFRVRVDGAFSEFIKIEAGVPQGSVLGPILYLIFTADMPLTKDTFTGTFADDQVIMATGKDVPSANRKLQHGVRRVHGWHNKWRSVLNSQKSLHTIFTNRRVPYKSIWVGRLPVPYSAASRYLGMKLDTKLRWKTHIKVKLTELRLKVRRMHWLLGTHSKLSLDNKVLLYKVVLRPVWAYGFQL